MGTLYAGRSGRTFCLCGEDAEKVLLWKLLSLVLPVSGCYKNSFRGWGCDHRYRAVCVDLGTSCRRWYKLMSVPKKKQTVICGEFCLKVHTEVLKLLFGVVSDNRETSTSLRHAETFSVGLRCQFPS